ncbi:hypothetical protein [Paenibacillus sp. 481]|uniref:hypothetical protein n=1 Tax=Paenibacillus sp. 481 TaxID=2835869 RepID=UPI001E46B8DA|nr:hypothetical protein [Paenibacillus sp. 481]UHA72366.1 hypothetical protein KIK04_17010 [Paenibacillus sp. 481]
MSSGWIIFVYRKMNKRESEYEALLDNEGSQRQIRYLSHKELCVLQIAYRQKGYVTPFEVAASSKISVREAEEQLYEYHYGSYMGRPRFVVLQRSI